MPRRCSTCGRRRGRIDVTVASRGRRQRKGIRVHGVRVLPASTSPSATTSRSRPFPGRSPISPAWCPGRSSPAASRRPTTLGLLDVPSVLAVSAGRPGAAHARSSCSSAELPHTRSDFEAAFLELCDRYGHPAPVHERPDPRLRGRRRTGRTATWSSSSTAAATTAPARRSSATVSATPTSTPAASRPSASPTARSRRGRAGSREPTRSTFSAWIFRIAPFRRASGSGASAPCSAQRRPGTRDPRAGSPARARESSTAPCPGTTCSARSTSGSSRASVARYADTEPPSEIHGISTGET